MAESFQLKAIITGVDRLSPVLDGISRNVKKASKGAKEKALVAGAFGTAWSLAFADTVKSAMDFESSMADVRKVVNFDRPEQFQQMSDDILKMSTQLPMAATEIAKIFAAGGQAGLAAKDLHQFAEDAVKMGVAFDESADDAGQQMAQWRVSLGMTQEQVEALADQINYLGNNSPTTSAKITDVVTRVGSLGEIAGVSARDVAALGATIEASGIQSDVAATAIKKIFTTLSSGKKMTKAQKGALHFLHLDPAKVATDLKKHGKTALLKVFNALSHVAPEKQVSVLKTLFGEESIGAIAPLLSRLDMLKQKFADVADSTKYAGSMQKEYASRANTTANNLQLLQNQIQEIKIHAGDALLPPISDGLKQASPLLNGISDFVKNNPEVVKLAAGAAAGLAAIGGLAAISLLVASAGTVALMLGALVTAGTFVALNWDKIKDAWEHGHPLEQKSLTPDQKVVADAYNFSKPPETPGFGLLAIQQEVAKQNNNPFLRDIQVITGQRPPSPFPRRDGPTYNYGAPTGQQMLAGGQSLIQGEMVVRFENAPPGMRVTGSKTNAPNVNVSADVGYSPYSLFRNPLLMR